MSHITVRVYGILIDSVHGLLVSDEFIRGEYFTKLPGGGLEFGEGTRDCLVREFKEETGLDISNSYERISREKIKRGFKFTHFSSSKKKLKMFLLKNKTDYSKSISMYYLVKIE